MTVNSLMEELEQSKNSVKELMLDYVKRGRSIEEPFSIHQNTVKVVVGKPAEDNKPQQRRKAQLCPNSEVN